MPVGRLLASIDPTVGHAAAMALFQTGGDIFGANPLDRR